MSTRTWVAVSAGLLCKDLLVWRRPRLDASRQLSPVQTVPMIPTTAEDRWVSRSVTEALMPAEIVSVAAAQPAFAAAALVSDVDGSRLVPVGLHVMVGVVGVGALLHRIHPMAFLAILYGVLGYDYVVATTPAEPLISIVFAGGTLTAAIPIVLHRGAWPAVVGGLVALSWCACIEVAHPGWGYTLAVATFTTIMVLCGGAITLMRAIRDLADRADREFAEAEEERRRVAAAKVASQAITEHARVLHDTIINTLGALARPDVLRQDLAVVQQRCRQDVDRIEALLAGSSEGPDPSRLLEFDGLGLLPIRRFGLTDEEIGRYEAVLPPAVWQALRGCMLEVIRNATKHSGADHVDLRITRVATDFVIELHDHGIGFDHDLRRGRGLTESVLARARDHEIRAELHSTPGSGTRVILSYRLDQPTVPTKVVSEISAAPVVQSIRRRMCWTWAAAFVTAGLVTETITRLGELTCGHVMLIIVGVLCLTCWLVCRNERTLPHWLTGLMITAGPAGCVLALRSVGFGSHDGFLFQTCGVTSPFIVLLVTTRNHRPFVAAVALTTVLIPVALALQPPGERASVMTVVVTLIPLLAVLVAWLIFHREVGLVGNRLAEAWHQRVTARFELLSREATEIARGRWNAAGLRESLAILRGVADEALSLDDPAVRRRCGEEEKYLRQLTTLTPDGTLLSSWFALALAEARSRGVQLRLQTAGSDIGDPDAADAFGRLVLACLTGAPAGSELIVSVLEHRGGPHLFVLGGRHLLGCARSSPTDHCEVSCQLIDNQAILEAAWNRR